MFGMQPRVSTSIRLNAMLSKSRPLSNAYPIFAQQGYENPREATGCIVCANCL